MKITDDNTRGDTRDESDRSNKLLPNYRAPDEDPFTVLPAWVWVAILVAIFTLVYAVTR